MIHFAVLPLILGVDPLAGGADVLPLRFNVETGIDSEPIAPAVWTGGGPLRISPKPIF